LIALENGTNGRHAQYLAVAEVKLAHIPLSLKHSMAAIALAVTRWRHASAMLRLARRLLQIRLTVMVIGLRLASVATCALLVARASARLLSALPSHTVELRAWKQLGMWMWNPAMQIFRAALTVKVYGSTGVFVRHRVVVGHKPGNFKSPPLPKTAGHVLSKELSSRRPAMRNHARSIVMVHGLCGAVVLSRVEAARKYVATAFSPPLNSEESALTMVSRRHRIATQMLASHQGNIPGSRSLMGSQSTAMSTTIYRLARPASW
jgi:hypothetical protein